jgi:hypothetical protein
MRCPKCGFISFDDLVACAKCNFQLEGKNAPSFEGTAIQARHAILLRETEPGEPELMPAEEQEDASEGIFQELAAESLGAGLAGQEETQEEFDLSSTEPEGAGEIDLEPATEEIELPILETEKEPSAEEFDLSLAEPEGAGEIDLESVAEETETPIPETDKEEIPAIDLSGLGDEEADMKPTETGNSEPAEEEALELGVDREAEKAELDLALEEDGDPDLPSEGETERNEPASSGGASNLDDIDLSGLMGEEEEDEAAAEDTDGESSEGFFDLADLTAAESTADDILSMETDGDQEPADDEPMLDLAFEKEDEEPATDSFELDSEAGGEDEEMFELRLESEEEDEESTAASETEIPLSGLSLENEEDD